MKNTNSKSQTNRAWLVGLASIVGAGLAVAEPTATAVQTRRMIVAAEGSGKTTNGPAAGGTGAMRKVIKIESVEPSQGTETAREVTWLGVSTEETTEVLAAQLGLKTGQGLVVIYVAPDSPAAKAGIQKHDVLVELGDQMLVAPTQLRKLIQMQKETDTIKLTFQRGGKKQTLPVALAKRTEHVGMGREEEPAERGPKFQFAFVDGKGGAQVEEHLKTLYGTLAHGGTDQQNSNSEVQRDMEELRQAIQQALHESPAPQPPTPAQPATPAPPARVDIEKDATVTVTKDRAAVKTIVKSDEAGVIVIVASPKKHLTAHGKDGQLRFDGEIESEEGQRKVPADLWEKVKTILQETKPMEDTDPKPHAQSEIEPKI